MAGFDIPETMGTLYKMLEAADWTKPSSKPDEWLSWDGRFEIQISHSSSLCTIRARRTVPQLANESTQDWAARKRRIGWSFSRFKPHGQTATPFAEWLGKTFGDIVVWCTQMASVTEDPAPATAEG